jgi:hypothetical protein
MACRITMCFCQNPAWAAAASGACTARQIVKEKFMASIKEPAAACGPHSRCYRLTSGGRACLDRDGIEAQTMGVLSPYLHDVLEMCGTGVWFAQLQQFMPPRSLDESLRSLLAMGLIESVEADRASSGIPALRSRKASMPGDTAHG